MQGLEGGATMGTPQAGSWDAEGLQNPGSGHGDVPGAKMGGFGAESLGVWMNTFWTERLGQAGRESEDRNRGL